MELEVLGVRVGAPLGAACSSYAVSGASTVVLLDCGPGALERLWDRGLAERLDAIVISHMHMDHVLDLLPFSGEITSRVRVVRRSSTAWPGRSATTGRASARASTSASTARATPRACVRPASFGGPVELAEQGAVYPTPA